MTVSAYILIRTEVGKAASVASARQMFSKPWPKLSRRCAVTRIMRR